MKLAQRSGPAESRQGCLCILKTVSAQSFQCSMVKMSLKPTHAAATSQQLHHAKGQEIQISVGKLEGNLNLVNYLPE